MNSKEHWEKIYRAKSPREVSWYRSEPSLSLEFIASTGSQRTAAIIDVGGGASALVDRLHARGHRNLAVLDMAEAGLLQAQRRLGKDADEVTWFQADATRFVAPHPFDIWHDRAVFHFLTNPSDRRR